MRLYCPAMVILLLRGHYQHSNLLLTNWRNKRRERRTVKSGDPGCIIIWWSIILKPCDWYVRIRDIHYSNHLLLFIAYLDIDTYIRFGEIFDGVNLCLYMTIEWDIEGKKCAFYFLWFCHRIVMLSTSKWTPQAREPKFCQVMIANSSSHLLRDFVFDNSIVGRERIWTLILLIMENT